MDSTLTEEQEMAAYLLPENDFPELVLDDEELAFQLQAMELSEPMEESQGSSGDNSRTDEALSELLQSDEMVAEGGADATDEQLAKELEKEWQNEEDRAASDYLIARHLQDEIEAEEKTNQRPRPEFRRPRVRDYFAQVIQAGRPELTVRGLFMARQRDDDDDNDSDDDESDDDNYETLLQLDDDDDVADNRRGLSKNEINVLPMSRFKSTSSQSQSTSSLPSDVDVVGCQICLCDFDDNDTLRTLPCLHRFHAQCIDRWIQTNAVCPVCRVSLKEEMRR